MKNWNYIAWIKAAIIVVLSIHYVFFPVSTSRLAMPGDFIAPLLVGIIIVPLGIKFNFFRIIIERPDWNDNPFRLNRFLIMTQFMAVMSITFGLVSVVSGLVMYSTADPIALTMLGGGLGFYGGILLTLKLSPAKQNKP